MSLRGRQNAGGASPSLAQRGRSFAQAVSDSRSTTFSRLSYGEEALADTNPQQSAGPALAPADSKLIQLQAQAAANAAQLAHFQNLYARAREAISVRAPQQHPSTPAQASHDQPDGHGDNSASTVQLPSSAPQFASPQVADPSADLLAQFMASLESQAEQSSLRLQEATRAQVLRRLRSKASAHPKSTSSKPVFNAVRRADLPQSGPFHNLFRQISGEELQAHRTSVQIKKEALSQDSHPSVLRDDGFEEDQFVIDDDLATSSESGSESDDDSLYQDSEDLEVEDSVPDLCAQTVDDLYPSKTPAFKVYEDPVDLSPLKITLRSTA